MARNLIKAGYPLVVHNRSRAAVDELVGAGAKGAASPRDVARQCDVLITMLPNSPDVEQVALGKDGIIEGARSGLLFVDMSTISPIVSQKIGKALDAKGAKMLGNLDGQVIGLVGNTGVRQFQSGVNLRQSSRREFHVDDGSKDLGHAASGRYGCGHAFWASSLDGV